MIKNGSPVYKKERFFGVGEAVKVAFQNEIGTKTRQKKNI
jgi:hypothetical protein